MRSARRRRPLVTAVAALVLAPWLAWAVIRTLGLDGSDPLVKVMAFTSYAAASSVVPLGLAVVLRRWRLAVLALAVCVTFAFALVPRGLGDGEAQATTGGRPLTVMTANIYAGRGDARTLVDLVRSEHVDVLALEELTSQAVARLDAAGLDELMPHRVLMARPGAGGTGLAAREPLDDPGQVRVARVAAQPQATLRTGGRPVRLTAAHPLPPLTSASEPIWSGALRALPSARAGAPAVLLGDFNATLDQADFRALLDRGWHDAADATGDGLRPTWRQPRYPPITIDHVLMSPGVRAADVEVHPIPGSDHRAVIARLRLPG